MSFFETPRFDETISNGASGGPRFMTTTIVVDSGAEFRNGNWSFPLHEYDVAHGLKTQAQLDLLRALFWNARGKLHGFRFKDWSDFTTTVSTGVCTLISGDTYQLGKTYAYGAQSTTRTIKKPISGTLAISGGGVYTVDYTTGIVTRVSGAAPTVWSGEFDVPVRFDTDAMKATIDSYNNFSWGQIVLVELRNP
jgi:uncharacterized protein (TIGR02217 family)